MTEKEQTVFLWNYLVDRGKFELIDLLNKSDKRQINKVIIKRRLVPDQIVHNTIVKYLEDNGVEIIKEREV